MIEMLTTTLLSATAILYGQCDPDGSSGADLVAIDPVVRTTESGLDIRADAPPSGASEVPAGSIFFVELWASQLAAGSCPPVCGLCSVFADLSFDTAAMSCIKVQPADNFDLLATGTCRDGLVDEMGGLKNLSVGDLGIESQWVRISTVRMRAESLADGSIVQAGSPSTSVSICACGSVTSSRVAFGSAVVDIIAPSLCLNEQQQSPSSPGVGSEVVFDVELGPSTEPVCGARLFLAYAPDSLTLLEIEPDPDGNTGFSQVLLQVVDPGPGTIDYVTALPIGTSCNSQPDSNGGTTSGGTLARFRFFTLSDGAPSAVSLRVHDPPTALRIKEVITPPGACDN